MLKTQAHSLKAVPLLVCALGVCLALHGQPAPDSSGAPNFWAVVVGISKFKNFPPDEQLEFADKDAEAFAKFILSERGRSFPKENVRVFLNQDATAASVRKNLASWLPRQAKSNDIVYIFLATHGMVEKDVAKQAFLVTHDADPEDLYVSSLPMKELDDIIASRLVRAGRIVLFADACRSGKLGSGIHGSMQEVAGKRKELIGLMASRSTEFSQEGKQFCGGHGVFTCFLLKGLTGAADADKDKTVTVSELIDYLNEQVRKATTNQQHFTNFGSFENDVPLAFPDKPGADLGFPSAFFSPWKRQIELLASQIPVLTGASDLRLAFDRAIKEGRLLAPAGQSAWELYQNLVQSPVPQAEKEDARDSLAIALEDEGQKILVSYLRGDAMPLNAAQYRRGAELFSKAFDLASDFPKLKAKARFCDGRALLMENKYGEAESPLQESIKIDPDGAYSYNALGIDYLNLRRYNEAVQYFRSAVERAPKWAYPHYNLALIYTEMNRLQDAERSYKDAIARGPNYSYLHLNLGELYLRMNRQPDAERELRRAIELRPDDPHAYNMLGGLYQMRGDLRAAEAQLRKAIEVRPDYLEARINLAKLLLDRNKKDDAERVLREALKVDMRNADAHRALGSLLLDRRSLDEAETEFISLLQLNPTDPRTFVLLGDLHVAQKKLSEAANDYGQALQLTNDPVLQNEVKRKLGKVKP